MTENNEGNNEGNNNNAGDGAGEGGEAWYAGMSEDLRGDKNITRYDSLDAFAKGHIELGKKVGANTVVIPGEDADDDQISDFHKKLGRPEKAEDYKIKIPEGAKIGDDAVTAFKEDAFKAGLTPKKANDLFQSIEGRILEAATSASTESTRLSKEALEKATNELTAEWGANNFDKNKEIANGALDQYGGEGVKELLESAGLSDHPKIASMFLKVAKDLSEERLADGPGQEAHTIADIEGEMSDMRNDKDSAFRRGDKAAIAKYERLNQEVFAAKQAAKRRA